MDGQLLEHLPRPEMEPRQPLARFMHRPGYPLPGIPEQPYGTQRISLFEASARIARECTVWNRGSTGEPLSPTLRVSVGPSIHG